MNAQPKITASDGWIEHDGTGCPVPPGTRVFVRLSDGFEDNRPSSASFWASYRQNRWRRCRDWHITHYRIVEPVNLPARLDRIAERRAA